MDEETRERGKEEEVNYASVVFNSNISASKGAQNGSQTEADAVYDEVKVPGALEQMTPAGDNDQKHTFKYVVLCLGILCVILAFVLIILSSYFFMKGSALESKLQHSKEKQLALLAANEEQRKELNTLNFTCAQSTIDAYCRTKNKSSVCRPCEDGWLNNRHICYLILNHDDTSNWKTWAEARDDCRGKNADLVVIDNEEEQDIVYDNSYSVTDERTGYWLGLSDSAGNGTWSWVNGTKVNLSYWTGTNVTSSSSHCAITWKGKKKPLGWSVVDCKAKNRWMCEKPALSV